MKRFQSETADHLNARIQEKLNQCDFSKVTDICEYTGFLATMVAVDNPLRKRMFLDKIDTYAKARIAVKNDEQATANSKLTNDHEAAAHAASTYKKDQRAFRQNFNPDNEYRPRDHSRDSDDSNYSGHSSSRNQPKSRGGYKGKNHDGRPSRDQSQARGRSES